MSDIERINKLFALVFAAFVWAYKIGIFLISIRPIFEIDGKELTDNLENIHLIGNTVFE